MKIKVDSKYQIISDPMQYILQELQIRNSEVTTVDELFKLIKKLDQKIEKLLGGN